MIEAMCAQVRPPLIVSREQCIFPVQSQRPDVRRLAVVPGGASVVDQL